MLAALTPPDVEVSICDENLSPIDLQEDVDLVGITAVTQTAGRAYEIADAFRAKGTKVVLGGMHPSALPGEASQHADAVVIGEAELVWASLCDDYRQKRLRAIYRAEMLHSLVDLPMPRRDLFAKEGYAIRNSISTTRGCPFDCSFCSVSAFYGRAYRHRPIDEVVQEVRTLDCGNDLIFFVDDNIFGNPRWAKELFRALMPLKVKWFSQGSINMARDHELLQLASASGCVAMFIGLESLSRQGLESIGKKVNLAADYEQAIDAIHSHGISILGAFIFGLDSDDENVFERTVSFAKRVRLEAAQFAILTPYPGTSLRQKMESEDRILTNDWSQYNTAHVVFRPKLMSPQTLQMGRDWAWREFYSLNSIWQRLGLRHPHLMTLYALNLNFHSHERDTHGKRAGIAGFRDEMYNKLAYPAIARFIERAVSTHQP